MRLIDADALKEHTEIVSYKNEWYETEIDEFVSVENIDSAPTIEPKRGVWIPVKASIYPYGNDVKCSVCGHRMGSSFGYNFCPMCGADMREVSDE